ncbi:MAG: peptide chain release factor N(5)-glutamine methyltransferase, partial [Clostridia bacterium]|nr:peptide chain release factor N(5)-glutamine methyltransferase [Clostridia bacterium]
FILDRFKDVPLSILDIGTGTGCIPISLAHFRKSFSAKGIDISDNALKLAKKNAENLAVSDRVSFENCDILTEIPNGNFDIIVSNPPYIKSGIIPTLQTEVRNFEPILALDGGGDGLKFYRRICNLAPKILKKGGLLAFEIGFDQADEVKELMSATFENIEVTKDLAKCDRVVSGNLR